MQQQAIKGAAVNACADQMLALIRSLACYDMRDVTTADSDETTLNGTLYNFPPIPVESFTIVASRNFFPAAAAGKKFRLKPA
jgi:hypothetical protein